MGRSLSILCTMNLENFKLNRLELFNRHQHPTILYDIYCLMLFAPDVGLLCQPLFLGIGWPFFVWLLLRRLNCRPINIATANLDVPPPAGSVRPTSRFIL